MYMLQTFRCDIKPMYIIDDPAEIPENISIIWRTMTYYCYYLAHAVVIINVLDQVLVKTYNYL